jgi:hypothetical protein
MKVEEKAEIEETARIGTRSSQKSKGFSNFV